MGPLRFENIPAWKNLDILLKYFLLSGIIFWHETLPRFLLFQETHPILGLCKIQEETHVWHIRLSKDLILCENLSSCYAFAFSWLGDPITILKQWLCFRKHMQVPVSGSQIMHQSINACQLPRRWNNGHWQQKSSWFDRLPNTCSKFETPKANLSNLFCIFLCIKKLVSSYDSANFVQNVQSCNLRTT